MSKVKILCVGPTECGKTVICNFLADATEVSGGDYRPTQGVRILEFEASGLTIPGRSSVDVELWDCSGDKKFEACWPALVQDAMGVIFVYNPDQANHDEELEKWYTFFGSQQSMKVNGCIVFSHHRPNAPDIVRTELPAGFSKMQKIETNIEDDPESVRIAFNRFLTMIVSALSKHREKEELNIMNQ
ncbi:intraflagellar transport protein 22 homolog isoform X2 [Littorina saxatilis]|uniref:Intraflagellar transport protein 22 homolog n=1 Tax=Littorina saxatilis TaxID=31220 RepID=A0AAN9AHR7_9CAEN